MIPYWLSVGVRRAAVLASVALCYVWRNDPAMVGTVLGASCCVAIAAFAMEQ